jgi:hypothetical protein
MKTQAEGRIRELTGEIEAGLRHCRELREAGRTREESSKREKLYPLADLLLEEFFNSEAVAVSAALKSEDAEIRSQALQAVQGRVPSSDAMLISALYQPPVKADPHKVVAAMGVDSDSRGILVGVHYAGAS